MVYPEVPGLFVLGFERLALVIDDGQDVIPIEDPVFLAIQFDFRPAVFVDEHTIALFYFEKEFLSIVVRFARADRHDEAFHRFFLGRVGNDDPALLPVLHFLFHRFYKNAVAYGSDFKCHSIHFASFFKLPVCRGDIAHAEKVDRPCCFGAPTRGLTFNA